MYDVTRIYVSCHVPDPRSCSSWSGWRPASKWRPRYPRRPRYHLLNNLTNFLFHFFYSIYTNFILFWCTFSNRMGRQAWLIKELFNIYETLKRKKVKGTVAKCHMGREGGGQKQPKSVTYYFNGHLCSIFFKVSNQLFLSNDWNVVNSTIFVCPFLHFFPLFFTQLSSK